MGRSLQEESTDEEIPASDGEVVEDPAETPAGTTAAEDDEEVLVDTGIKYEALYPAPYLTLQQV